MLYDQPYNAMRVRANKLGEAIFPEKFSLRTLEAAVCNVVDGSYSAQVEQMRISFMAMEEARLANLLINSRLANIENASKYDS